MGQEGGTPGTPSASTLQTRIRTLDVLLAPWEATVIHVFIEHSGCYLEVRRQRKSQEDPQGRPVSHGQEMMAAWTTVMMVGEGPKVPLLSLWLNLTSGHT
jgi:hypothetical protein